MSWPEQKKNNGKMPADDPLKNLEALKNVNYREANKYFQVTARVKFSAPPATTVFLPAYVDKQNYIFLIAGGFEKNYQTSFVQMLLHQYVLGYFKGLKEKSFHEKELYHIFNSILDSFSPDIYNAAFTLCMGHVNVTKAEFKCFSIHQAMPVILNEKNYVIPTEVLPIFYESKYAKIINATKIKLRPKCTLVNYVSGKELTTRETMDTLCLPYFTEDKADVADTVETVFSNLPEKENDQLVMAIKLL